ncbi:MAG TPA: YihY/virulence factor BrkB family protein [Thermomicrobiales bacterium]|nr:YihY/virulence factor BrkB family protein [Thermomicrobiales bacterium]
MSTRVRRARTRTRSRAGATDGSAAVDARRLGEMIVQSGKDLMADKGTQWAAAITYYALLASVPLLLVLVSIAAFFVEPGTATDRITETLGEYVPQSSQVENMVQGVISERGTIGIFSFITLLWTGSRVFSSLIQALNIVYEVEEDYSFLKRLLVSLAMTFSLGFALVLALGSGLLLNLLRHEAGFLSFLPGELFTLLTWLIRVVLLGTVFYLIYQYVPRGNHDRRASLVGAIGATFLFVVARPLFVFYMQEFGNQNLIYGSLAVVIIALLWVWIATLISLFGGELASHTRSMLLEGESGEAVGQRRKHRVSL